MRRLSLVVLVGVLGAGSAFAARKPGDDQQTPRGYEAIRKKEEKKFPTGAAWIAVSKDGKAYGGSERPGFRLDDQFRVSGFGGCNSFSATAFPLRDQGIAVGPLAITKRSCDKAVMDSEMAFLTALRSSAKWDTAIGTLTIRGPSGELKFERSL